MAETVNIRLPADNYLAYMRSRRLFEGKHNRRKVMILVCLFHKANKRLTSRQVWQKAGYDVSYSSLRATLSNMVKYGYISRTSKGYGTLAKGLRLLYAASEVAPSYHDWYEAVR